MAVSDTGNLMMFMANPLEDYIADPVPESKTMALQGGISWLIAHLG